MREKIKAVIKKSLGNGKVKILLGPYSRRMDLFLLNEINKPMDKTLYIREDFPKDYLFNFLKLNLEINKTRLYIVNRITEFEDVPEIINLFEGKNDVDLIITSNMLLGDLLKEQSTLVRGRVQIIFFPAWSYDDVIEKQMHSVLDYVKESDEMLFDELINYKYIDEAKRICRELITYIGYPLSFRGLHDACESKISPNTFVSVFNYIAHRGLLNVVQKLNLADNHIVQGYWYCFPSDISLIYHNRDLNNDKWARRTMKAAVISKIIGDGTMIFKADYRNESKEETNGALLDTYVVLEKEKHYLLKMHFDGNEKSLEQFRKQKYLLQKCVVLMEDVDKYVGGDGILYIGFDSFLRKGI